MCVVCQSRRKKKKKTTMTTASANDDNDNDGDDDEAMILFVSRSMILRFFRVRSLHIQFESGSSMLSAIASASGWLAG